MTSTDQTGRSAVDAAQRQDGPWRRFFRSTSAWMARHPRIESVYRLAVGAVGAMTLGLGLLLVPLPGPGWLVVFVGLAILGTEFGWAGHLADGLRRLIARVRAWWPSRQQRRSSPSA